ncbi:hypothetical protein HK102_002497, partial [Quaeritorhiza haematococci]
IFMFLALLLLELQQSPSSIRKEPTPINLHTWTYDDIVVLFRHIYAEEQSKAKTESQSHVQVQTSESSPDPELSAGQDIPLPPTTAAEDSMKNIHFPHPHAQQQPLTNSAGHPRLSRALYHLNRFLETAPAHSEFCVKAECWGIILKLAQLDALGLLDGGGEYDRERIGFNGGKGKGGDGSGKWRDGVRGIRRVREFPWMDEQIRSLQGGVQGSRPRAAGRGGEFSMRLSSSSTDVNVPSSSSSDQDTQQTRTRITTTTTDMNSNFIPLPTNPTDRFNLLISVAKEISIHRRHLDTHLTTVRCWSPLRVTESKEFAVANACLRRMAELGLAVSVETGDSGNGGGGGWMGEGLDGSGCEQGSGGNDEMDEDGMGVAFTLGARWPPYQYELSCGNVACDRVIFTNHKIYIANGPSPQPDTERVDCQQKAGYQAQDASDSGDGDGDEDTGWEPKKRRSTLTDNEQQSIGMDEMGEFNWFSTSPTTTSTATSAIRSWEEYDPSRHSGKESMICTGCRLGVCAEKEELKGR